MATNGPLLLALFVASNVMAIVISLRTSVSLAIGADGVFLRRKLGRSRFVRFADIARVKTDRRDLVLVLGSGETIRIGLATGLRRIFGHDDDASNLGAAARRIEEGRTCQVRAAQISTDPATALARGGRTPAGWLRALRAARSDAVDYRHPAIPADALWRIVEDVAAPGAARAGAAVALAAELDDPARARLRVAADTCAAPEVRVAFEAAMSEADDPALERALSELEDDETARRRSSDR